MVKTNNHGYLNQVVDVFLLQICGHAHWGVKKKLDQPLRHTKSAQPYIGIASQREKKQMSGVAEESKVRATFCICKFVSECTKECTVV